MGRWDKSKLNLIIAKAEAKQTKQWALHLHLFKQFPVPPNKTGTQQPHPVSQLQEHSTCSSNRQRLLGVAMTAQGKIVTEEYSAHLENLANQEAVSIALLEAYLMSGAGGGGVIQSPAGEIKFFHMFSNQH